MILPVLMFPQMDPAIVAIGPITIRWYGLAYVSGILLGWFYLKFLARRLCSPITADQIDAYIPLATLGIVGGGRLGHVLFYAPLQYLERPWEIFFLWQPGMSFHGGLIGVVLVTIWFCRNHKIALLPFGDLIASVVPIGLFFGRLANFVNGELWGRPSSKPWAMIFPHVDFIPRHPSQLYEAFLEGIVLLCILGFIMMKTPLPQRKPGFAAGVFLMGYGVARIMVEAFREPDAHLGYFFDSLTWGQILSLPLIIAGGMLMIHGGGKKTIS